MKKKIVISVIIVLLGLLIFQLIFYNSIRKDSSLKESNLINTANNIEIENNEVLSGNITKELIKYRELYYPRLISVLYDNNYEGPVMREEIAKSIYNLVTGEIAKLYEDVKNKNVSEMVQYYSKNASKISSLGITSAQNFVLICDEIKNVYRTSAIYSYSVIDTDTFNSENGYYTFNLDFVYTNDLSIHFKCCLPEKDANKQIIYSSNSDISKIFERYKGTATENGFVDIIYGFMDNIQNIRKSTRLASFNDEAKYFEQNKSKLNKIGIYSATDFQNVAYQINQIHWGKQNQLCYYRLSNYKEEDQYATVELIINYDLSEDIKITINLAQKEGISPIIKLSAEDIVSDNSTSNE